MGFYNNTTIVGNLTRDPELRFSQAGMPITTLGVAWNRRRQDREDEVSFFNVVCFKQLAENVAESLRKGMRVVVYGTLQQRRWETVDGEQRAVVEILADDVAPSLSFATAEVRKNEYRGGAQDDSGQGYGTERAPVSRSVGSSGRPSAASSQAPATTGVGAPERVAAPADVDDEPF